jgi:hypothetical protein
MTPEARTIADAADAVLAAILPQAERMQAEYLAQHGRYWQGLWTQDDPPADGEQAHPDASRHPSDQLESWLDTGAASLFPSQMRVRMAVDTYAGTLGQGWVLQVQFEFDGRLYARAIGFGPEARSQDWVDVTPGAVL